MILSEICFPKDIIDTEMLLSWFKLVEDHNFAYAAQRLILIYDGVTLILRVMKTDEQE